MEILPQLSHHNKQVKIKILGESQCMLIFPDEFMNAKESIVILKYDSSMKIISK